jgi:hypothetical protein
MPELDFMSGEIGYLLTRQTYDAIPFKLSQSRPSLAAAMQKAFEKYNSFKGENARPEVRASALAMEGVALAL